MYFHYQDLARLYFQGDISMQYFWESVRIHLPITPIYKIDLPKAPCMVIANHPLQTAETGLSTSSLGYLKGYNYLNTDTLWFPMIREIVIHSVLHRPITTLVRPLGYDTALSELGCLPLPPENGVEHTAYYFRKRPYLSCCLYPEGGFNKLSSTFHKGLYYIAKNVGYTSLMCLIVDPWLGLGKRNRVVVSHVESIPDLEDDTEVSEWIGKIQTWYISQITTLYKSFQIEI